MSSYAYGKQWRLDRHRGIHRIISSAAAKRRIDTLVGQGWSLRAIAGEAGIAPQTVSRIHTGRAPTVRRHIVAAITAIPPGHIPAKPSTQVTEPFVPRVGTVRRIQALLFLGWTHREMQERSGCQTRALLAQSGRWVTRSTHDSVSALYDELWMRPGPSSLTRGWAQRLGYVSPLAWDDIDLDEAPTLDATPESEEAS